MRSWAKPAVFCSVSVGVLLAQRGGVLFDCFKGFCADDMLHAAGVLFGGLLGNADRGQEIRERGVALVYGFGDLAPCVKKGDVTEFVHFDIAVFTKIFHGNADAGFCILKLTGDINRAHHSVSFL